MDISGYNRNEAVREEKRAAENTAKRSPERPGEGTARYLFTTSTCPNCRAAREMLAEESYEVIDAERHPELVQKYGILQAPTLVVLDHGETFKYVNASNIQRYVTASTLR